MLERAASGQLYTEETLHPLPPGLRDVVDRCVHPDPRRRYKHAAQLAVALERWLTGHAALARAQACMSRGFTLTARIDSLRAETTSLHERLVQLREKVGDWGTADQKARVWELEDRHELLLLRMNELLLARSSAYRQALTHAPGHADAHAALAEIAHADHCQATQLGDSRTMSEAASRLDRHDIAGRFATYRANRGRLQLRFSRTDIRVSMHRELPVARRMRLGPGWSIRPDELADIELPAGAWMLVIQTSDGLGFQLPVHVPRRGVERWEREGHGPQTIYVPTRAEVPFGTRYVPAGASWVGGDTKAYGETLPLARQWIDGFAMQRFATSNRSWVRFLNSLVERGDHALAERCEPRERPGSAGGPGAAVYGRRADGTYFLTVDGDGDAWSPHWGVVFIDWPSIEEFCNYTQLQTGFGWQVPYELQWVRAARGADTRMHPWGNWFDPTFCSNARSSPGGPDCPPKVSAFPDDRGPFGIRGLAGGVTEFCRDRYLRDGPTLNGGSWTPCTGGIGRVGRGGNWGAAPGKSRVCFRTHLEESLRAPMVGFRMVVPVGPQLAQTPGTAVEP
jgi:formylglycine-generating enzyme required for sulfatase activity